MTKTDNSDLESFIKNLEEQTAKVAQGEAQKTEVPSNFAGNSIELDSALKHQEAEVFIASKKVNQFDDLDFSIASFFKTSVSFYKAKFFSFVVANTVVIAIFLALSAGILALKKYSLSSFLAALDKPWEDLNLLTSISLMFVVFFSIQRLLFLTILSNNFEDFEQKSPITYSFKKLFSFIATELMQIALILVGAILVVLAPFFAARYFLAPAILVEEDLDAVESLIKSSKRAELWMIQTMRSMLFVNFVSVSFVATIFFGLSAILNNQIIACSLTFLIFSLFVLPLHSCFKFIMHKKLQKFDEAEISKSEKIKFISARMIIFAAVGFVLSFYTIALLNNNESLSIDSIVRASGISDWLVEIINYKSHYSGNSNN